MEFKFGDGTPYYASDKPIGAAHIVNLGFVINVIEDPVERREALQRAFTLAEELLVVSAMLSTDNPGKVTFFGDGVLTSRSTFQKYYSQAELRDYLRTVLDEEPIPVAPGIFFVFKDKDSEQRFQAGQYRSKGRVHHLVRPARSPSVHRVRIPREKSPDLYAIHRGLLDNLWEQCIELGREPDASEIQNLEALEQALGSIRKALKVCFAHNDVATFTRASHQRADDLKVYLALQLFQKRKPYKKLEPGLQRDVRAFFGDYKSAQQHGRELLFQVARPEVLNQACEIATEQGLGWYEPSYSLQLHSSLVQRLPAVLRVYVGCAAVLYGDVSEADLVKIHIRSGKVSFLKFDDFAGNALPRMTERTKINLRTLDLGLYVYGNEYPSPLLYLKSRYMNEELLNYPEQLSFDQALKALGLFDLTSYGPAADEFFVKLKAAHWKLNGFCVQRDHVVPNLDEPCGRYFTYRQLIECGETQIETHMLNLPKNPQSYTALRDLATNILDPVVEYFGGIELTYAFCSLELAKRVPARNAPKLDQHAAHETGTRGTPICPRLGAAVDFMVRDENMKDVADWIIANLPFDRLYFYGVDRPLHVSYGPEHAGKAFEMAPTTKGTRIPRPLNLDQVT